MLPRTYRRNLKFLTVPIKKKSGAKCRNWGFGAVKGHSRSSAMSSFDRVHMTSYLTLTKEIPLNITRSQRKEGWKIFPLRHARTHMQMDGQPGNNASYASTGWVKA